MSLKPMSGPQRRRGRALEEALLDAVWAELSEHGYDELTFDGVATRAGTSRAVLYRRWPRKPDLVHAALMSEVGRGVITTPDTGTLRGDVIGLLRQANEKRVRLATLLVSRMGDFYREADINLAELSALAQGGRDSVLDEAIQRAIARGEIQAEHVTERIARLPIDLFRNELIFTLRPVPDETILEIVDTIFLPLVSGGCQTE